MDGCDQIRFQFKVKRIFALLGIMSQGMALTLPQARDRLADHGHDYCSRTINRDLVLLIDLGYVKEVGAQDRHRNEFCRYVWTGKKLI